MAVINAQTKRMFETQGDSGEDGDSSTETWRVITTTAQDDVAVVLAATGLPKLYQINPKNIKSVCSRRRARRSTDNPRAWFVTIEYAPRGSLLKLPDNESGEIVSALHWRPDVSIRFVEVQRPIIKADRINPSNGAILQANVPVTNSLGDLFDPPPEETVYLLQLTYRRNEAVYNIHTLKAYCGKQNSDVFLGTPAGTWQCLPIGVGDEEFDSDFGVYYRKLEYTFLHDPQGFDDDYVNYGFRFKDQDGNILPTPNKEPRNLDVTTGELLEEGDPPQFVRYRSKSKARVPFAPLNIDLSSYTTIVVGGV